ncbi:MAG: diguanylate cyclase [Pseudomonadota bacterium]
MINSEFIVLLIEDSPEDIYSIQTMLSGLKKTSIVVKVAKTLSEGLDYMLKGEIDLILLDLSLPDSNGIECLKKIRSESIDLPIIVLTEFDDEETAVLAISEGAQDYLCKNTIESHSLWRSIRHATEREKMVKELNNANRKILKQQKSVIEEERLKVLLQLSGATAHELNQPLMALLGNIELMRFSNNNPDKAFQYLDKIEEAGKRIADIVQKIQTIRHDKTTPYTGDSSIINIDQKIKILSVEDTDNDFKNLSTFLKDNINIDLKRVKRLDQAIKLLKMEAIDLILLDYLLPDGNGFDMLNNMKKEALDVPVIVITGQGDEIVASKTIQAGAFDYLPKDKINGKSLYRTIINTLDKARLKRQVKEAHERIANLSVRDELTGLYNRRFFMESLEKEIMRANRYQSELTLCILDLDHFKNINDAHGHPAGDIVLSEIGKMLSGSIRETDIACRHGGEEFAVILPYTNIEDAKTMIERFRETVAEHQFEYKSTQIQLTASAGIAQSINVKEQTLTRLVEMADKALYQAKKEGRNRTVALTQ